MPICYTIIELREQDLQNGFLETLSFLSDLGEISSEKLSGTFSKVKQNADNNIFVAVTDEGKVVGTITLLIEQKFIHGCGRVGHIEDVAVHENFRGQGIACHLIDKAINVAKEAGCYKIILDCKENLVSFYEKFGFEKHEIEMRLDLR